MKQENLYKLYSLIGQLKGMASTALETEDAERNKCLISIADGLEGIAVDEIKEKEAKKLPITKDENHEKDNEPKQ